MSTTRRLGSLLRTYPDTRIYKVNMPSADVLCGLQRFYEIDKGQLNSIEGTRGGKKRKADGRLLCHGIAFK